MNLEDFISQSLVQIVRGIQAAQSEVCPERRIQPAIISPNYGAAENHVFRREDGQVTSVELIEFDIAVTASDGSDSKAGAGISVISAFIGGQHQAHEDNSSTSRIRFKIPVSLPMY